MDEKSLRLEQVVSAPMLTWLCVHGLLCVALRHPGLPATTRTIGEEFVEALGGLLVSRGVLTPEQLEEAQRVEADQRVENPICRVCGCTNERACPGGCSWIEPDLCSRCAA